MKRKKKQSQNGASRQDKKDALKASALRALAAAISGAALVAGFAPYNIFIIPWIALVPLLWSLKGATRGQAAFRGYIFGVALFACLFWWIAVVGRLGYPADIGYVVMCILVPIIFIPWSIPAARLLQRGTAISILACAGAWIILEWLMSQGMFAFPWWQIGNTQAANLVFAQAASIGGVYMLSFFVLLFNIFVLFAATGKLKDQKALWGATLAIIVAMLIYGGVTLSSSSGEANSDGEWEKVAVIQPSIPQEDKDVWGTSYMDIYSTHMSMTTEAVLKSKPDIIIWPETSTFLKWLTDPGYLESTVTMLKAFDAMFVAGVYESAEDEAYNSVVAIEPESGLLGVYRKIRIVPFGEAFPFRAQIEKLSPELGKLIDEQVYEIDIVPGEEYKVFKSKRGNIGAMICFESIFPAVSRKMVLNGADFLFTVTNDAWFLKTPGVYQHAYMGALRSIETHRYMVQAGNSGLSFISDPYGRITTQVPVFEKTVLNGKVRKHSEMTLYARFGDWFCALCALFCAAAIVTGIINAKKS